MLYLFGCCTKSLIIKAAAAPLLSVTMWLTESYFPCKCLLQSGKNQLNCVASLDTGQCARYRFLRSWTQPKVRKASSVCGSQYWRLCSPLQFTVDNHIDFWDPSVSDPDSSLLINNRYNHWYWTASFQDGWVSSVHYRDRPLEYIYFPVAAICCYLIASIIENDKMSN